MSSQQPHQLLLRSLVRRTTSSSATAVSHRGRTPHAGIGSSSSSSGSRARVRSFSTASTATDDDATFASSLSSKRRVPLLSSLSPAPTSSSNNGSSTSRISSPSVGGGGGPQSQSRSIRPSSVPSGSTRNHHARSSSSSSLQQPPGTSTRYRRRDDVVNWPAAAGSHSVGGGAGGAGGQRRSASTSSPAFSFWSNTFFRRNDITAEGGSHLSSAAGADGLASSTSTSSSGKSNRDQDDDNSDSRDRDVWAAFGAAAKRRDARGVRRAWEKARMVGALRRWQQRQQRGEADVDDTLTTTTRPPTTPTTRDPLALEDLELAARTLIDRSTSTSSAAGADAAFCLKMIDEAYQQAAGTPTPPPPLSETLWAAKVAAMSIVESPAGALQRLFLGNAKPDDGDKGGAGDSTALDTSSISIPVPEAAWIALIEAFVEAGQTQAGIDAYLLYSSGAARQRRLPSSIFLAALHKVARGPQNQLGAVDALLEAFGEGEGDAVSVLNPEALALVAKIQRRRLRYPKEAAAVERLRGVISEEGAAAAAAVPIVAWNYIIEFTARNEGEDSALGWVQRMQDASIVPDQGTLRAVLVSLDVSSLSAEEIVQKLQDSEDSLQVRADATTWTSILVRVLGTHKSGQWRDLSTQDKASRLYAAAVADDVAVTAELAEVLIRPLCYLNPPNLPRALQVYGDFLAWYDEEVRTGVEMPYVTSEQVKSIYTSLFRALANQPPRVVGGDRLQPSRKSIDLLDDMRERHFTLSLPTMVNEIQSLMDVMPDHHDAFRIYSYTRALQPDAFDEPAYHKIISTFCKAQLPQSRFAAPQLLFEFLKDMRASGIRPSARIFTTIIDQYAKLARNRMRKDASEADMEMQTKAVQAIQRVHAYLKLDSFLDVDVPLLNALMDAYNQSGAWADCWGVWDELMMRYRYRPSKTDYQPSLSIALDACGYSYDLKRAKSLWKWAQASGMTLSHGNWAAYIECLSRNKRAIEATELLVSLRDEPAMTPLLDARLLAIPLRFSRETNERRARIVDLLKEHFPSQWPQIKTSVVDRAASSG